MANQISFSSISFYKTEFDLLYQTYIASPEPQKIATTVSRMVELQGHMLKAIQHAFANPPRRLPIDTGPIETVDADTIKKEIQGKLERMIAHNAEVLKPASAAPAVAASPKAQLKSTPAPTPALLIGELAVGFANLSANCWINSLLSMLPSFPSLRTAFETVGRHYVQSKNEEEKKHGQFLLDALNAYDSALARNQSVPAQVSQNVRLAFHHFFPGVFSKEPGRNEDASEALQMLMGLYESIVRSPGRPMPPPFAPMQTKRHYRPIGSPMPADPAKVRSGQYSKLSKDNVSTVVQDDYQILIDLQNKGHLSFSDLVLEYFCNTTHGDNALYLLPGDTQVQQFELTGEGRQFTRAPEELLVTLKRFGANRDGSGFKIAMPLAVTRTFMLPGSLLAVYELDAFNVHSGTFGGGHYSTYRKVSGRWIEINDASVRFVSEEEIDVILEGRKGPEYTSYMHHYVRMDGATLPARSSSDITELEQEIALLSQSIRQLEENAELSALPTDLLETFRLAIWMHDGSPDIFDYGSSALAAHPEKVREIRRPWLIAGSDSLWDQMLQIQKLKLQIATEKYNAAKLQVFLDLLNSSATNPELLANLKALPQTVQNTLHGLIYQSHLIKFGREKVDQPEYGKKALEQGDIRKTLLEADESVLNLWGKNIALQLIADIDLKAKKLQIGYEKEQLQGFYDQMVLPPSQVNNLALLKAFERLDIRAEIKDKLMWHIWYGHRMPAAADYGLNTFRRNPRVLLQICEPNLARPPFCPVGANILYQMIALLDQASH